MGKEKNVSCVILNYNDADTTLGLVEKICGYPSLNHIVVVDNASTDDSAKRIRRFAEEKRAAWADEMPRNRLTLLTAEKNGGYGAGNNLGIRYCLEVLHADHILIANPDVEFTDSFVAHLSGALTAGDEHRLGAVTGVMRDPVFGAQKNVWPLFGLAKDLMRSGPICRRLFRAALEYPESYFAGRKHAFVDCIHGSLLMVDAKRMKKCGGYDEQVFLYNEETILAKRFKDHAFRSAILLTDSYLHRHSASISKTIADTARRQELRNKSALYYYEKYLNAGPLRLALVKAFFQVVMWEIRVACCWSGREQ